MEKEAAIAIAASGWWKDLPSDAITAFQLYERRLCMDFSDFHKAVEQSLDRPVWTHEFAKPENLQAEFEGKRPKPTMQDILDLIPAEKRILFVVNP